MNRDRVRFGGRVEIKKIEKKIVIASRLIQVVNTVRKERG